MSREQFIKDSVAIMKVKLVRPQFRVDNRSIFYKGQGVNITGFDAGVLLKEKFRLTIGYYSSNSELKSFRYLTDENSEIRRELLLRSGSINTEFVYKNTRFFSLGMPLEFGFGYNQLNYVDSETGIVQSSESGLIVHADFGLSLTFKPIRWVGLKTVVGYRKTAFNQVKDFTFDGVFTSIGLNVDIREIVKDVQMFRLKKKYYKNANAVETAVDLITD